MTSVLLRRMCRHRGIGYGAMHLSSAERPDRLEACAVVHATLDMGVRTIDTADAYCIDARDTGHNERLVAEAIDGWDGPTEEVVVITKGGHRRTPDGGWYVDGRPEHLTAAAHASRERLGVDAIPLYLFHRPDPATPFARSIGALAGLVDEGVVRQAGVSNVDLDQLEVATDLMPVAAVQNELSPLVLDALPVLARCDAASIPFLAWGPFGGRGGAPLDRHPVGATFAEVAARSGASPHQIVLAWLRSLSPVVVPIPGSARVRSVVANAEADAVVIDPDDVVRLDAAATEHAAPQARHALDELRAGHGLR